MAVCLAPLGASAAVISGFGSPSDAIPGGTVETFESVNGFYGSSLTLGNLTLSGIGNTGAPAVFSVNSNYSGSYNTTGASVNSPPGYPVQWRFDFANVVDAFAFNLGAHDLPWTIAAYTAADILVDTLGISPINSTSKGEYYGIAGSNIAYAVLNAGSAEWILIDNVTYNESETGGSIPEPTTLALLGLGLAGIGFSYKKKRQLTI